MSDRRTVREAGEPRLTVVPRSTTRVLKGRQAIVDNARMWLILLALAVVAAVVAHGTAVGTLAIVNAVAAIWANGVIANFGPHESDDVPNWAAIMSAITLLLTVIFLVVGIVS